MTAGFRCAGNLAHGDDDCHDHQAGCHDCRRATVPGKAGPSFRHRRRRVRGRTCRATRRTSVAIPARSRGSSIVASKASSLATRYWRALPASAGSLALPTCAAGSSVAATPSTSSLVLSFTSAQPCRRYPMRMEDSAMRSPRRNFANADRFPPRAGCCPLRQRPPRWAAVASSTRSPVPASQPPPPAMARFVQQIANVPRVDRERDRSMSITRSG